MYSRCTGNEDFLWRLRTPPEKIYVIPERIALWAILPDEIRWAVNGKRMMEIYENGEREWVVTE